MSTRAQIVVTDSHGDKLWFYKHCDGYPEGTLPILEKFLQCVKDGKIRNNAMQGAGWLIVLGRDDSYKNEPENTMYGWKVSDIEPCVPETHGDIEYLYVVDLVKKDIKTLTGSKASNYK